MVPASVMWHPAIIRPGNALWQMVQHTPLRTCVRRPLRLRKHTPRNYNNDGRTRHLRWHDRCDTWRPMRMARWAAPRVALVRSCVTF